jgi:hypothetical protein
VDALDSRPRHVQEEDGQTLTTDQACVNLILSLPSDRHGAKNVESHAEECEKHAACADTNRAAVSAVTGSNTATPDP